MKDLKNDLAKMKIDEKLKFIKEQANKAVVQVDKGLDVAKKEIAHEYKEKKKVYDTFDDENKFMIFFLGLIACCLVLALLGLMVFVVFS